MRYFIIKLLLFLIAGSVKSQTVLHGSILSTNGEPIPKVIIKAESQVQPDIFAGSTEMQIEDGNFHIVFEDPGIYSITISAVFHSGVRFPLLVYDQESIEADIYIRPKSYNEGKYFDQSEYMEWIRVYGDFNHYDYDEGTLFSLNEDGSVTAEIPADSDTIRYQVRGLTSGVSVLPGAASYNQRADGSFEAILVKSPEEKVFEIHYDPSEEFPYPRFLPDSSDPVRGLDNVFFMLKNPADRNWIEPLILRNRYYTSIGFVESQRDIIAQSSSEEDIRDMVMGRYLLNQIDERKKQVESEIEKEGHHQQQLFALYIAYAGLLAQEKAYTSLLSASGSEHEIEINSSLLSNIIRKVPAVHPLWAGRFSPVILAELLKCSDQSIQYLEKMAGQHFDNNVVRETVLFLVRYNANRFSNIEDMPYYQWVIRRYGNRNLARVARNIFRDTRNERSPDVCRQVSTR